MCEKISDHQQLGKEDTDTSLKLIIVDGKMVDAPIVLRAERTLKLAAYLNLQQEDMA